MSIDNYTRLNITWKTFGELFANKLIRDSKMEAKYTIQDELKKSKEEIKNKFSELSKIQNLNEALIKEVQKLK
jgi:hypothetical protein